MANYEYYHRQVKCNITIEGNNESIKFKTYVRKFSVWILTSVGNGFIKEGTIFITDYDKAPPQYLANKIKQLTNCDSMYISW